MDCRQHAVKKFSLEVMATNYEKAYRDLKAKK